MTHPRSCEKCARALASCRWCGTTEPFAYHGVTYVVEARTEWDGDYHQPCYEAEQEEVASINASRSAS